jgi:Arf-GAP/GTPase/ANK repeat/PH domain-containing protein 1/3
MCVVFQFCHWVDAVIFVFSLENEFSFQAVYSHFAKMAQYRDTKEIPLILVGTQGESGLLFYTPNSQRE